MGFPFQRISTDLILSRTSRARIFGPSGGLEKPEAKCLANESAVWFLFTYFDVIMDIFVLVSIENGSKKTLMYNINTNLEFEL